MLYVLLALFSIILTWACLAELDIVATAPGKLETSVKIVQPAETGIVKQILVDEGDRVRAGQVLLRLDTTVSAADLAIVAKEVELRELQIRRIDAELSGRRMKEHCAGQLRADCNPQVMQLFREVEAQGLAHQRTYADTLRTEQASLAQAQEELLGARAQLLKLEKLLTIFAEQDASLANLAQQGLVSKIQYAEKQRERIETEQDLASQRRSVGSLESRVAESQGRIARVTSEYRQQLLNERVEAQATLGKAREELSKQHHRGALSELRAPQDGVIKDVATYTVGAVVSAGTVLMTLVPVGKNLVAEVFIRNEDVGFVHEGQAVKVKLATYPFQKYGMIEGTVRKISADAAQIDSKEDQPQSDVGLSPYKAVVQLNRQALDRQGTSWALAPGMQVAAEIREGRRTVLEYLLSPVQKVVQEAARER